jgi:DNA-binding CsgD family transcriptional regulator
MGGGRVVVVLVATLSNPSQQVERLFDLRTTPILSQPRSRQKAPKPLRRLNPDEIQDLLDRYQSGETMVELGIRYGINRRTVSTYLQKAGLPSRHRTMDDEKVAQCIDLYNSGLSLVAVGERLGIDQATVRRALLSAGVYRQRARTG